MLYNSYLKQPNYIHCHRAHLISYEDNNKILKPYSKWKHCIKSEDTYPSFFNFCTSGGGVLFKKKLLYKDICNIKLFNELSPQADDIWFWAMSVLQGTKINVIEKNINIIIEIGYEYYNTLYELNVSKNDIQLNNIMNYYGNELMNNIFF